MMKEKTLRILKQFRPYDFILIGLALALSFLPVMITSYQVAQEGDKGQKIALLKIRGEVVDQFILQEGGPHEEITYRPSKQQYNIIEVDGDRIRVKEDNSPDQIAVQTGWISEVGQISVCLPHQLMIEIQGPSDQEEEEEEELILPL